MTFSDSRVVDFINQNFIPVWESVSPVRIVTFDLGENRSVKGTVSGEIALYFCNPEGQVFDILPALHSPAATLEAMKKAASYARVSKKHPAMSIDTLHRVRMEKIAGQHFVDSLAKRPLSTLLATGEDRLSIDEILAQGNDFESISKSLQKSEAGIALREEHIHEAIDEATTDLRQMASSKIAMPLPTGSPLIVVEPGGKDYYRWEVAKRFLNPGSWHETRKGWAMILDPPRTERTPAQWKDELFTYILKQPLDQGQQVTYDSDSLKAIRIIQE